MALTKTLFGKTKEGAQVWLFTLANAKGQEMAVTNYGAAWVRAAVPDKNDVKRDVVLGYDKVDGYFDNGSFFGVVIGPNGNRIDNAEFELNGKKYQLDVNDGKNNLHSHKELGYHKKLWDVKETTDDSVTFAVTDNATMGFPGNKTVEITYSLSEDGSFKLKYHATSDAQTIINLTNHSYFNLEGEGNGRIEDHLLELDASGFIPVVQGAIPTGEIKAVKDTPFDFTSPHKIGERINDDCEQLKLVGGYDHNWVIDGWKGEKYELRKTAKVTAPGSGITMEVYTTLPGVQFYAGNFIGTEEGKSGHTYSARSGFALETQYYPDTIHHDNFPSCIFGGELGDYESETVYKFV